MSMPNQPNLLRSRFAPTEPPSCCGLLPYITAGYPDVATTVEILRNMPDHGIAAVELGIPFSDPIADGPVIQTSFSRALSAGFRIDVLLNALRDSQGSIHHPLLAMVSYSIVYRRGVERFARDARASGIHGLIVPDLSLEEAPDVAQAAAAADCPLIMIAAPTTTSDRLKKIARLSDPFVYYQSVAGITGERSNLAHDLPGAVAQVRTLAGKPVCVGFGISNEDQVRAVASFADGVIVGSAIVRKMNEAIDSDGDGKRVSAAVCDFVGRLAAASVA